MKKTGKRFESEVHIGLLVIIFILLFLNVATNYIIFHARVGLRENTTAALNSAAVAISRAVQKEFSPELSPDAVAELKKSYGLSGLMMIPSRPADNSADSRRLWFVSIAKSLGPDQIPEMAEKILAAEFHTLTRGRNYEYYYVYPVPSTVEKKLLILSVDEPALAYLDDSSRNLLRVSTVVTAVVVGLYLLLFRYIVRPFKTIRKEAVEAGRLAGDGGDGVEAVVEDYRTVISELRSSRQELLVLNKAIQRRADSLEQFNQYLLSSTDSGIVTLDNDGKIRFLNQAAERILGQSCAEGTGRDYRELFAPSQVLIDAIASCLGTSAGGQYREYEFVRAGGEPLFLGITVSMISSDRHKRMGASLLINDLTALRNLRSELETKNRLAALGEMSGGLAHQLRNSIGAILGYSRLVRKHLDKVEGDHTAMAALEEETKQAEILVERFLNFARPLKLSPEPVRLEDLLADLMASFAARNPDSRIEFVMKVATTGTISVDPLLMKQALSNIIDNAVIAYEDSPGKIEITLSELQQAQVISVKDWGCGIPKENLNKIFTPFFSSRPSGSGLGLPLAAKIIDLHGGHIAVKSGLGTGAEFVLTLPLDANRFESARPRQSVPTP